MSTEAETELTELRARMRAQNEYAGERGEAWVNTTNEEFKRLPKVTIVVINCRTGEYVTGSTRLEAADEFERRLARKSVTRIEIGGGYLLGGEDIG